MCIERWEMQAGHILIWRGGEKKLAFIRRLCFINHSNEKRKRCNKEEEGFLLSPSPIFTAASPPPPPPSAFLSLTHILYTFPSFLISAPSFIHSSPSSSCQCVQRQPIADGVTYICLSLFSPSQRTRSARLAARGEGGVCDRLRACMRMCADTQALFDCE